MPNRKIDSIGKGEWKKILEEFLDEVGGDEFLRKYKIVLNGGQYRDMSDEDFEKWFFEPCKKGLQWDIVYFKTAGTPDAEDNYRGTVSLYKEIITDLPEKELRTHVMKYKMDKLEHLLQKVGKLPKKK